MKPLRRVEPPGEQEPEPGEPEGDDGERRGRHQEAERPDLEPRERRHELELLERDLGPLERIEPPFPRVHYDDAVEMINQGAAAGARIPPHDEPVPAITWGDDFGSPHETYVAEQFDKPVFVHHYPTGVKAFYMAQEPERPETCRSSDLRAPEGYGEIIGGGERSGDLEFLEAQIARHELPRDAYEWYLSSGLI